MNDNVIDVVYQDIVYGRVVTASWLKKLPKLLKFT